MNIEFANHKDISKSDNNVDIQSVLVKDRETTIDDGIASKVETKEAIIASRVSPIKRRLLSQHLSPSSSFGVDKQHN